MLFSSFKVCALATAIALMPLGANALRSEKNAPGQVYGWCDFTWANAGKIQNVQCGAKDQARDDHPVYTELWLYSDNGHEKTIARYDMDKGYNQQDWDDTKHSWDNRPRSNLSKARVRTCVNLQLNTDTCFWGNYVDNPHEAGTTKKFRFARG